MMWISIQCVFHGLSGMRGDWGWIVYASHLSPGFARSIKLCQECSVLFLMGSRDFDAQIWALRRHHGHMGSMLDSDWSRQKLLRCDWSVPTVACITTVVPSSCLAFRALITQARIWKSFRFQNSTRFLYLPIPSSAETWKIVTKKVSQFIFA